MAKKSAIDRLERNTRLDMALVEYVRAGYNSSAASNLTGVHHSTILRKWRNMDEIEQNSYIERANSISEAVEDIVVTTHSEVVADITTKLRETSDMAVDELRERLQNPFRRAEIKDADLVAIVTKCLTLINEQMGIDETNKVTNNNLAIFNIFDQSIQDDLIKHK